MCNVLAINISEVWLQLLLTWTFWKQLEDVSSMASRCILLRYIACIIGQVIRILNEYKIALSVQTKVFSIKHILNHLLIFLCLLFFNSNVLSCIYISPFFMYTMFFMLAILFKNYLKWSWIGKIISKVDNHCMLSWKY